VNVEGFGDPLRILQTLFPGGNISLSTEEGSSGTSPLLFLLGDNNRTGRRDDEALRRFFGRPITGGSAAAPVNRWTDDGQTPLQAMIVRKVSCTAVNSFSNLLPVWNLSS
jgi:hypothetical protein